jgi:hypothetical protein
VIKIQAPPIPSVAQTYGEHCLERLTPEFREWVETAGSDWLVASHIRYARLAEQGDQEAEWIATAIAEIGSKQLGYIQWMRRVEVY